MGKYFEPSAAEKGSGGSDFIGVEIDFCSFLLLSLLSRHK